MAFMNVSRSYDATYEFLESCAQKGVEVAFVRECWVEHVGGQGTQSHPDFVRLRNVYAAHRVACFALRSVVDMCRLVDCAHRFVCVKVGGVQIGGVHG